MASNPTHVTHTDIANIVNIIRNAPPGQTVKKKELRELTGLNDRQIRAAVAEAILMGLAPIVTDRSGGGYRITLETGLVVREIRRLCSAAKELQRRTGALAAMLIENGVPRDVIFNDDEEEAA